MNPPVRLASYTSFRWDRLFIFPPNTPTARVARELGPRVERGIGGSGADEFVLVFLQRHRIAASFAWPGEWGSWQGVRYPGSATEGAISEYTPKTAVFESVLDSGGVAIYDYYGELATGPEFDVEEAIINNVDRDGMTPPVHLASYTTFRWDRLFVFPPETPPSRVAGEIGDRAKAPVGGSAPGEYLLVFKNRDRVVGSVRWPIDFKGFWKGAPFGRPSQPDVNVYTPRTAVFDVREENNRISIYDAVP